MSRRKKMKMKEEEQSPTAYQISHLPDEIIYLILQSCYNLQELTLCHVAVSADTFPSILANAPRLEKFSLRYIIGRLSLDISASKFPSLKFLSFDATDDLHQLQLSSAPLLHTLIFNGNCKFLNVVSAPNVKFVELKLDGELRRREFDDLILKFPSLESLSLYVRWIVTDDVLRISCHTLRKLTLKCVEPHIKLEIDAPNLITLSTSCEDLPDNVNIVNNIVNVAVQDCRETRERERGRVWSRVRSRERGGECFFPGGPSPKDLDGRVVQNVSYRTSIEESDGRFGSNFKSVVEHRKSSHFIFLDKGQLVWLHGVLQVAAKNGWKLPLVCESSSKRRTIAITQFHLQGRWVLKIYEKCLNQKVFFVIIPVDSNSDGWPSLLKMLQRFTHRSAFVADPKQGVLPKRSFAEVVSKKVFSEKGSCFRTCVQGFDGIKVEAEGVEDRVSFLKQCVVFRFSYHGSINWKEFRIWANKQWGVPVDVQIKGIRDDLWMLVCNSMEEADRVVAFRRTRFGQVEIQLDRWIKGAGRSAVSMEADMVWLLIRGLPLHLRSEELFKSLGERCGKFLGFEET
ncbi:hypothetical protein LINGRAHAP2_LOCUS25183 [Linum grandiflorum]